MKEFLERYLLPICGSVFGTVVLVNPLGLSFGNRVSLGVAVTALAYCIGRGIEKTPITPDSGESSKPSNIRLHKAGSLLIAVMALGYLMVNLVRRSPPTLEKVATESPAASPAPEAHPASEAKPGSNTARADGVGDKNPEVLPASHVSPDGNSTSNEAPDEANGSEAAEPSDPSRVEVLYEGPTAGGGVVNPGEIMMRALSDAGFDVLIAGSAPSSERPRKQPQRAIPPSVAEQPAQATQPSMQSSSPPPHAPSGLTVKQIFDFVRKSQQGTWIWEPRLPFSFGLWTTAFAAPPAPKPQVLIAMRASMRRLRENQGIFSVEAQMQIAAVTAHGKTIQSVVAMTGPEMARGFGLDWDQAEEKGLTEISSQMCPAFAKQLREKLTGAK